MNHVGPEGSVIWTVADANAALAGRSGLPLWALDAYREMRDKVLDEAFPCTFGTVAQRKGEVLYAFLEERDGDRPRSLVEAVRAFTERIRDMDRVTASLRPFVVIQSVPSGVATIDEYFAYGWDLLVQIHAADDAPWPDRIPREPDDARWSFCFSGIPLFVTFKTPAYRRRRSRRVGNAFVMLFQARDGFDQLAGETPQGRRARARIREKLVAYDGMPIPEALGHYGSAENREWKQYFAPEGDAPVTERCPFHVKGPM